MTLLIHICLAASGTTIGTAFKGFPSRVGGGIWVYSRYTLPKHEE
jgi:hypothetical protein